MEAYGRIGIDIQILRVPSERSLKETNAGIVDAEMSRIRLDHAAYPHLRRVPVPLNILEATVYTKLLDFNVDGWKSLEPYSIGIRRGAMFAEQGTAGMNVIAVKRNEQLIRLLERGRVELIVMNRIAAEYEITRLGVSGIRELSPAIHYHEVFHYVHQRNSHLIDDLSRVLLQMRNSGEIETIVRDSLSNLADDRASESK